VKPETKLITFIFALAVIFAVASKTTNKELRSKSTLTPFAKTLDVLSMFSTKKDQKPNYTVYGYLPYWSIAQYKNFQYDKLTDIAYFGLYIKKDGSFRKKVAVAHETVEAAQADSAKETQTTETEEEGDTLDPGYNNWVNNEDLNKVIQQGKKKGVRFALTVISHEDDVTDSFLACTGCWKTLLENIGKELDSKEITDINLNFEYATESDPERSKQYLNLTKYLNAELDRIYGDSRVIVTAFADSVVNPRVSSEVAGLGRYSDGIFVMGYDFHTPNSEVAGPVAPIDGGNFNSYDIRKTVRDFLTQIPPNKFILGVPYYGYNWVVETNEPYAKRIPGTDEIGHSISQPYDRIMDLLKGDLRAEGQDGDPVKSTPDNSDTKDNKDAKDSDTKSADTKTEAEKVAFSKPEVKWDDLAACPYFSYVNPYTKSTRQVYYDDAKSIKVKYDLVKENKLQGVGIWALGYDGIYNDLWNQLYESFIKTN